MAEEAKDILLEGPLGVKRKKGVEPRHFRLYADRLVYFKTEADAKSGAEPRGHLNFDDILSVDASEDGSGFTVQLQDQGLDLASLNPGDVKPWIDRLREELGKARASPKSPSAASPTSPARGAPVMEGPLGVERKGKVTSRHFVVYSDSLEYFEDASDKDSGRDPRGRIMLEDVAKMEIGSAGLSIFIEGEKRALELRTDGPADLNKWANMLKSLGVKAQEEQRRPDSPAREPEPAPSPAPASAQRGASAVLAANPMDRPLVEGVLNVVKKGKSDARHAVLFRDRFEYYNSREELNSGATPRCRVPVNQLIDMFSSGESFTMQLQDRTIEVQAPPGEGKQWITAWLALGFLASGTDAARRGIPAPSTLNAAASPTPGGSPSPSPSGNASGRKVRGSPTRQRSPSPEAKPKPVVPPLKTGTLEMMQGKTSEPRFLALYNDRLEFFNNEQDYKDDGKAARSVFAGDLIKNPSATKTGFKVDLDGASRVFICSKNESTSWVDALANAPSNALKSTEAATASTNKSSKGKEAPPPPDPTVVLAESLVTIARKGKGGKTEKKLCKLYCDRLEHAVDAKAFAKGNVQTRPLADLQKAEILAGDKGFGLTFTNEEFDMIIAAADFGTWRGAWQTTQVASKFPPDPAAAAAKSGLAKAGKDAKGGKGKSKGKNSFSDPTIIFEGEVAIERESKSGAKHGKAEPRFLSLRKAQAPARGCVLAIQASKDNSDQAVEVKLKEVRAFKFMEQGFCLTTDKRDYNVQVATGLGRWATAFKEAFKEEAAAEAASKGVSPRGATNEWASNSPSGMPTAPSKDGNKAEWSVEELQDPRLVRWLQGLRERDPPVHHGLLGVSPKGQLVTGYFVLFKNRLDFWNSSTEAAQAYKPRGRILMNDVRSLETVSSGFILNSRGHKMGLHVRNNDELHAWSKALLSTLSPAAGGNQVGAPPVTPPGVDPGSDDAAIAPTGQKVKLKLSEDIVNRMYKGLTKATEDVQPKTQDAMFKFLDKANQNGTLGAEDIVNLLKPPQKVIPGRMSVPSNAPDPLALDANEFVKAMSETNSGKVMVTKLADFILYGGSGTPGISRARAMLRSRSWVPRVATLTTENHVIRRVFVDPEEQAQNVRRGGPNDIFHKRAQGKSFTSGREAGRPNGNKWGTSEVCRKVHLTLPDGNENLSPQVPVRSKSVDSIIKDTSVIGERVITPRQEPGYVVWGKINHKSQDVHADPQHMKLDHKSSGEGCHVKVGEENRHKQYKRMTLTEKITDPLRQPLADKEFRAFQDEKRMAPKVTDASRSNTGWAAPFAETKNDLCRGIHEKVVAATTPRRMASETA